MSQVQFLIVGVIRQHASPNPTLQIHLIWAIRAYSSSKSMGQEHRQQSSKSMGSNNSSKRIGNGISSKSSSDRIRKSVGKRVSKNDGAVAARVEASAVEA